MKRLMILLAVATLPAAAGCCCTRLCPLCPCNWFNRGACAPAPTYAAPLAAVPATYVPSPCAPAYGPAATTVAPLAATVTPQYIAPPMSPMMSPMMAQSANACCPQAAAPVCCPQQAAPVCCPAPAPVCCPQPTSCCMPEPSCAYSGYPMEMGYGGSYMGNMSYGPMMESGGCSSCSGDAGIPTPTAVAPAPAGGAAPRPNAE